MQNPTIGQIQCPHCGQSATIHQNKKGKKLFYYRCGEIVAGVSSGCGTCQIYGQSGQQWIIKNGVFTPEFAAAWKAAQPEPEPAKPETLPTPEPEPEPEPNPQPDPKPETIPAPKHPKGFLTRFSEILADDGAGA